jgi:hypothetical protein
LNGAVVLTPDPAGLASVNPAFPQSWNRYVYVLNDPLRLIDPTGLGCSYFTDDGSEIESVDYTSSQSECDATGGSYVADSNGEFGRAIPEQSVLTRMVPIHRRVVDSSSPTYSIQSAAPSAAG